MVPAVCIVQTPLCRATCWAGLGVAVYMAPGAIPEWR